MTSNTNKLGLIDQNAGKAKLNEFGCNKGQSHLIMIQNMGYSYSN